MNRRLFLQTAAASFVVALGYPYSSLSVEELARDVSFDSHWVSSYQTFINQMSFKKSDGTRWYFAEYSDKPFTDDDKKRFLSMTINEDKV